MEYLFYVKYSGLSYCKKYLVLNFMLWSDKFYRSNILKDGYLRDFNSVLAYIIQWLQVNRTVSRF